jgi:hypothetical protein
VTLDAMPVGLGDPEPIPVAPWVDEQTQFEERLATVEQDLERLRQRHAVVAADLDTLVAGEPWAQAEAVRVADDSALEAVEAQAERLQSLEGRLSRLEAAQRARAARGCAALSTGRDRLVERRALRDPAQPGALHAGPGRGERLRLGARADRRHPPRGGVSAGRSRGALTAQGG